MRREQAGDELKPETIWKGVFPGEELPAGLNKENLVAALSAKATAVMPERNRNMVEQFIQSADLDAAVDGIFRGSSPPPQSARPALKDYLTRALRAAVERGVFRVGLERADLLNVAGYVELGIWNAQTYGARRDALNTAPERGGSAADRLRLADLGLRDLALRRAVCALGAMRAEQGEAGELEPETVWKAVFGRAMPAGINSDNVGERVNTEVAQEIKAAVGQPKADESKTEHIGPLFNYLSWEQIIESLRRPAPITLDSTGLSALSAGFNKFTMAYQHELSQLEVDAHRMGISDLDPNEFRGKLPDAPAQIPFRGPTPTFTFAYNDRSENIAAGWGRLNSPFVGFTREDGSSLTPEQDRAAYHAGKESSVSRGLAQSARELCGPEAKEEQVARVIWGMHQGALFMANVLNRACGFAFNDHANINITFSRGENGVIRAEYATAEALRAGSGSFRMGLNIMPDGTVEALHCETSPRELPPAQPEAQPGQPGPPDLPDPAAA